MQIHGVRAILPHNFVAICLHFGKCFGYSEHENMLTVKQRFKIGPWSTHAHMPKFPANPLNTFDVSVKCLASVSTESLLKQSHDIKSRMRSNSL